MSSDSDKIGYPLQMEEEALKRDLYSQLLSLPLDALPGAFHRGTASQLGSCKVSQEHGGFGSGKGM